MKLIIDCHSLCYRSLYSIPELNFKNNPTSIIFGFLKQLFVLSDKFNTNQFLFAWDSRKSFRKEACSTYKRRENNPDKKAMIDLAKKQFNKLRQDVLPVMGFKNIYIQPGYEADDIIASLVYRYPDEYTIISKDEDLYQLLNNGRKTFAQIYNFDKVITENDFRNMYYGINPIKWANVKGLAGCDSDTVDGIPGIGIETALKYITGNLKEGKAKDKIESEEGKRIYEECFKLVSLPYLGQISFELENPVEDKFYSLDFIDTFKQYGCCSFLDDDNFQKWTERFKLQKGRK